MLLMFDQAFGTRRLFLFEAWSSQTEGRDDCWILFIIAIGVHFGFQIPRDVKKKGA